MSWVLLSILAAFLWALVNVFDKYAITKLVKHPYTPVMVVSTIGLIASILVYLFHGYAVLSWTQLLLAFLAGLFYLGMDVFYFYAIRLDEISKLVPLFYLTPLFILVLAALSLSEVFTTQKYAGIFLLVFGAMLLSMKKGLNFSLGKAFWLMILSCISLAISQVLMKYLLHTVDYWTVFSYIRIGTFLGSIPLLYACIPDIKRTFRKQGTKAFAIISVGGSLNVVAVLLITAAASVGYVTLVNALASFQPFFLLAITVCLSLFYPHIIKEEISKGAVTLKFLAVLCLVLGGVLVA